MGAMSFREASDRAHGALLQEHGGYRKMGP